MSEIALVAPIVTAVIGVLAGAASTYWALRRHDSELRDEHRKSVATALLFEIATLERTVTSISEDPLGASSLELIRQELQSPILDRFGDYLELFPTEVVEAVVRFSSSIASYRKAVKEIARRAESEGAIQAPRDSPLHESWGGRIAALAKYVYGDDSRAVAALEAAGGILPLHTGLAASAPLDEPPILTRARGLGHFVDL